MHINLDNHAIMKFFREISRIPRSSKAEEAVADYLVSFAKQRGLEWHRDEIDNVVIKKPGSPGAENRPPVMLQGHTDMVCEKNADTKHDFAAEGIQLIQEGNYLRASGTTLGADNGVAVAYMLALLDDQAAVHPPLECVFTVQEEIGLIGAAQIEASILSARTMINMDGSPFGTAVVSCAGGLRAQLTRKYERIQRDSVYTMNIAIRGLEGGHSGIDIALGRGNSIKILGRILNRILQGYAETEISRIIGGAKDNAIPRESECNLIFLTGNDREGAAGIARTMEKEIREELRETDPNFRVEVTPLEDNTAGSLGRELTDDLVHLLFLAPDGVLKRSSAAGGFIVASINLGVINTESDHISVTFAPRSSAASIQVDTKNTLNVLGSTFGFQTEFHSEYPGWSYAETSPIRDAFVHAFADLYGKTLKVEAIHAGLECGLFSEKLPGLDAISLGPTIHDCHTPHEKLDLESFLQIWELLLSVLKQLAQSNS